MYCSNCGSKNEPNTKFCASCGTEVAESTEVSTTEAGVEFEAVEELTQEPFRMKTRAEIKDISKQNMKEQWGTAILALLVYSIIVIAGGFLQYLPGLGIFMGMLLVYATIFFIDYPLLVNLEGMYIKIFNREKTSFGEMFAELSVNYMRKVGGMAWMFLFMSLWMMLLIIPGIVKAYAYSMTPFILASCPNVKARDALSLSKRMTKGYKAELFVMSLSFIGWTILSAFTLGILYVVYVGPYFWTTWAGYFVELRDRALAAGTIEAWELEGEDAN